MDIRKLIIILCVIVTAGIAIHIITGPGTGNRSSSSDDKSTVDNINLYQSLSEKDIMDNEDKELPIPTFRIEKKKLIKDVIIEKNPVCAGEDFKVTVLAENPTGPDSELIYRIGTRRGNPVILRYNNPGDKTLSIVVKNTGRLMDYRQENIMVRACPEKPLVLLRGTLSRVRQDEADFEVIDMIGLQGKCSYKWDFGDGSGITTSTGFISHNYGKREQNSFSSTFTASVIVTDENGNSATGRTSVAFSNIHWLSSMLGHSIIPVIYNRFPERSGSDYIVKIEMKNIFTQGIILTDAEVEFRPCNTEMEKETRALTAGYFISRTHLPGNSVVNDTLSFSEKIFPFCTRNMVVSLSGKKADNEPVEARLYLTIPMSGEEALMSGKGKIVTDRDLVRKIKKARRILGREAVTPSDIRRLEKEGKL